MPNEVALSLASAGVQCVIFLVTTTTTPTYSRTAKRAFFAKVGVFCEALIQHVHFKGHFRLGQKALFPRRHRSDERTRREQARQDT